MADRLVLFVRVENACRSLRAEAFFEAETPDGWSSLSAGTEPAKAPEPRTASMLREAGVRIPDHPPQSLNSAMTERAALTITMGCVERESCPAYLSRSHSLDWALPDPRLLDDAGFRAVREEIRRRVESLVVELSGADARPT